MVVEEYSEEKLEKFLRECTKECKVDIDIDRLKKLILEGEEHEPESPNRYYGLVGTKFVELSDIAVDFIQFIVCDGALTYMLDCLNNNSIVAPGVPMSVAAAIFIYRLLKKAIQLNGYEYCLYKQAVTHFRRFEDFSLDDMVGWLPEYNSRCNMHCNELYCRYRKNDKCIIKEDKETILDKLDNMCERHLLKPGKEKGCFRLNY